MSEVIFKDEDENITALNVCTGCHFLPYGTGTAAMTGKNIMKTS